MVVDNELNVLHGIVCHRVLTAGPCNGLLSKPKKPVCAKHLRGTPYGVRIQHPVYTWCQTTDKAPATVCRPPTTHRVLKRAFRLAMNGIAGVCVLLHRYVHLIPKPY